MKKTLLLFLILALSLLFIKPVLAEEIEIKPDLRNIQFVSNDNTNSVANTNQAPVPALYTADTQTAADTDLGLVVQNNLNFPITKEEATEGKKFKVFNNQFVFQIDKNSFAKPATLELKEYALGPNSPMAAPEGFQFASRIYEFDLKIDSDAVSSEPFWFSVKYLEDDYFRKTMYYFDEQKMKWVGLESLISNGASKIVSKTNFKYAKVAILDDLNIMNTGIASWYKYKGCNCAASPDYPKGTKLKVTNVDNGKSIVVKVNDWGPDRSVFPDRVIDLDKVAFRQIASKTAGLCKVKVELVEPIKVATK